MKENKLQVIMFCASWCSHCRSVAPKFEELAKEHTDIEFSKIDVDTADDALLDKFEVDGLPLIVAVMGDKEVARYNESDGTLESWLKFIKW